MISFHSDLSSDTIFSWQKSPLSAASPLLSFARYFFNGISFLTSGYLSLPGGLWVSTPTYEGPRAACQPAVSRLWKTVSFPFTLATLVQIITCSLVTALRLCSNFNFNTRGRKQMERWIIKDTEKRKEGKSFNKKENSSSSLLLGQNIQPQGLCIYINLCSDIMKFEVLIHCRI